MSVQGRTNRNLVTMAVFPQQVFTKMSSHLRYRLQPAMAKFGECFTWGDLIFAQCKSMCFHGGSNHRLLADLGSATFKFDWDGEEQLKIIMAKYHSREIIL